MTADFFALNSTFAVEMGVFVIVLVVVTRFVIRPLQSAMRRRQAEIDESLAKARRVEDLLSAAEADYQKTLSEARKEARAIIETADRMAADRARMAHPSGLRTPDKKVEVMPGAPRGTRVRPAVPGAATAPGSRSTG